MARLDLLGGDSNRIKEEASAESRDTRSAEMASYGRFVDIRCWCEELKEGSEGRGGWRMEWNGMGIYRSL